MIEPGVVRSRLLKKVLPFALAAGLGVFAADAWRNFAAPRSGPAARAPYATVSHSRTWLVIRDRPAPLYAAAPGADGYVGARLVVRFNADGTVSVLTPEQAGETQEEAAFRAAAVAAAKRIWFTPPTEDGRPLSTLAEVDYDLSTLCADGYDNRGRRFGVCRGLPRAPNVSIISVEGAGESDGWRLVYAL